MSVPFDYAVTDFPMYDHMLQEANERYEQAQAEVSLRARAYRDYNKLNKTADALFRRFEAAQARAKRKLDIYYRVKFGTADILSYSTRELAQMMDNQRAKAERKAAKAQAQEAQAQEAQAQEAQAQEAQAQEAQAQEAQAQEAQAQAQEAQAQEADYPELSSLDTERLIYTLTRLIADRLMPACTLTVFQSKQRTARYNLESIYGGAWHLYAVLVEANNQQLFVTLFDLPEPCADHTALLAAIRFLVKRVADVDPDDIPF
jgi:hypothetical protein